jgi:hypothetical protein
MYVFVGMAEMALETPDDSIFLAMLHGVLG